MHLEQRNTLKWVLIGTVGLIIGGVLLMTSILNKPQTYKTPAATRPGFRSVVCRWNITDIKQGTSFTITLLDKDNKVIRAIPNPVSNYYSFEDVDPSSFPTKCRLEINGSGVSAEKCVNEVAVTCQNMPTLTPTPPAGEAPSATPTVPTNTPAPGVPSNTPVPTKTVSPSVPPIGGPSGPTNTPVPLAPTSTPRPGGPTSTPAPTNTSVPLKPSTFPELPKAGINMPTMLLVTMGFVILLLAFAL